MDLGLLENNMLIAYIAHSITGRSGIDLNAESHSTEIVLRNHNIIALDPVLVEKIPNTKAIIPNRPDKSGLSVWKEDESCIRKAHVLIDIRADLKSEGVLWEIGYARFYLYIPVIRIYKPGTSPHMASRFKGDVIAFSLEEAAKIANDNWGTLRKRILWRCKMLSRSLPKFIWRQILEFK